MSHRTKSTSPVGELYTPQQLAERLHVPQTTLTDWRYRRRGPSWLRVGRLVRYPVAAVDAWLAAQMQRAGER